jgi:hypothetical protein
VHGAKQVDCLCKWLRRWPPFTNITLKHKYIVSDYIFCGCVCLKVCLSGHKFWPILGHCVIFISHMFGWFLQ